MEPEREITDGVSDEELADLARLADGTLPPDRRAEVEARVAASPELTQIASRQAAALDALRGTAQIGAPARLRGDVERRRGTQRAARRRSFGVVGRAPLVAAAAVLLALALVLPAAFTGGPSVADAAALAQRSPTQGPPAGVAGTPQLLRAQVEGVPFPNYAAKFGWKPVGARHDDPAGRDATTVYYRKGGRTIAYTIVSGDGLDHPSGAHVTKRGGVEYRTFRHDGRWAVTWERGGHTCVLSGKTAAPPELVALAAWRGKGAIPF